ncbi:type IV secretion system protein VirB10 [Aminobacter lissarensis]|uniref:Type IV secretion system protein VirB10 n=1 Tax=Aminobacter carboxidus TaxID=376165 RepID=A0A8E1WJN5_9HYPH|nr:IncP-type conjugal transfer protein TrbI [Aminobacter lissarensis]MBB6470280.1 type IV secretion system protein VirB10 [Aminobacter lissarensis]
MVQSLKLGGAPNEESGSAIRRLNRLPVVVAVILVVMFVAVIIFGLTSRGLFFRGDDGFDTASSNPASTYADQLKRGVSDGIIGEPTEAALPQPAPATKAQAQQVADNPFETRPQSEDQSVEPGEPDKVWKARLEREQREQYIRERHRQKMARLQASDAAYDSPLTVNLNKLEAHDMSELPNSGGAMATSARSASTGDLYAAALQAGIGNQNLDPNGQRAKGDFFNADMRDLGYLPNKLVSQQSPYELKRGSVIPATLITGINSDLPGRITAQVSQSVYDSATGHRLLIPQGTKLFGRYDSKVSFGQSRVLVVWTDIVFPNGSTLQIGGMAGADAQGNGGFKDKVDNHHFKTFGSAILLAIIGTGIDMAVPQSSTRANQDNASDAARRNFAETFGRVAERSISKNLDVQPTLEIRPGYMFNVLVDQDIVFPGAYHG